MSFLLWKALIFGLAFTGIYFVTTLEPLQPRNSIVVTGDIGETCIPIERL